jgi:hypothetical protein
LKALVGTVCSSSNCHASACAHWVQDLPLYVSKQQLQEKLMMAIEEQTFGAA